MQPAVCDSPTPCYGPAFGVSGAQKKKSAIRDALNSLSEISVGDLVVHQNHGIGRYAGIQRMAVQGVTKDYLRIEYDKKDVLYVPVTSAGPFVPLHCAGRQRQREAEPPGRRQRLGQDPQEGQGCFDGADGEGADRADARRKAGARLAFPSSPDDTGRDDF